MKVRKKSAFLIGGISFLLLQTIFLAGFFLFWRDVSSEEGDIQEKSTEALRPFMPPPQATKPNNMVLDRFGEMRADLIAKGTEFLEINFSKDKVLKYENGAVVKEVSVLAQGDPQGWGGTPAGLYEVLAKYKNAFSDIAQVYMPYAIHFYGKYYVHGEPD